jgi:hypothetical protein
MFFLAEYIISTTIRTMVAPGLAYHLHLSHFCSLQSHFFGGKRSCQRGTAQVISVVLCRIAVQPPPAPDRDVSELRDTGSNKMCWALLARHPSVLAHLHHGLQSVQPLTEHLALVRKAKPFASWWYGHERTDALPRRRNRSVRLRRRFQTHASGRSAA